MGHGKFGKTALWDLGTGEENKNILQGYLWIMNITMIESLHHVKALLIWAWPRMVFS